MTSKDVAIAHSLHTRLVEFIGMTKASFVMIGKLLYELQQNDSFQVAVGEGIDTWDDYIAQPEIGLSRGEANRLIQIYEELILNLGFDEDFIAQIPLKNLHYALPIVKNNEVDDPESLIYDASVLSQKDFREKVFEIKNPEGEKTYTYLIMKRCNETGSLSKVAEIEDEELIKQYEI